MKATAGTTLSGAANKKRILDSALSVFSQYGFRGTRIEQVAAAAGLSGTHLLYYFPSKTVLYVAVLERTLEKWLEPLRRLDETMDPRAALTRFIVAKVRMSARDPRASRLFAMEMLQGAPHTKAILNGPLAALVTEKAAVIERWIAAGHLAPIDPKHLIFAIWSTTQHYADFAVQVRALSGRGLKDAQFRKETEAALIRILLDGVLC